MDRKPLHPIDRDLLIRTVVGESAGQPIEGQAAVANVILNRAQAGGYGGNQIRDVVLAPRQFEPWDTRTSELLALKPTSARYRDAELIVDGVLAGDIPDTSEGATHFLNPDIVRQRRGGSLPSWTRGHTATIGGHAFYAPKGRVQRTAFAAEDDAQPVLTPTSARAPAASPMIPDDLEIIPAADPAPGASSPRPVADLVPDDLELVPERPATFAERFGGGPMASGAGEAAPAAMKGLKDGLQAKADTALVGEPSVGNQIETAVLRAGNTVGLNLPRNLGAAIASAPGIGNGRGFAENYQAAKDREEALSRQNPVSSMAGTGAGIGGAMASLPVLGVEQIAGRALPAAVSAATAVGRAVQAAVTGAGYAGAEQFADTKNVGDAARMAAIGGTAGGVLGAGGERLARAFARWRAKPASPVTEAGTVTPQATEAMRAAGADPAELSPETLATMQRVLTEKGVSPEAAREALGKAFGIDLSAGQAAGDFTQQQFERIAARGGYGEAPQKTLGGFFDRQAEQVAAAKGTVGERIAGGQPAIAHPLEAGELVASGALTRADQAAAEAAASRAAAGQALAEVRGPQPADAIEAGATAAEGIRGRAAAARDAYRQGYDEVASAAGTFEPGALDRMGSRVRVRLGTEVPVDPVLTPNAARALGDLDNLPALLNTAGGAGPSLREVDQVRKRLVSYYRGTASNPTDRRAMREVLGQFDNHLEDAMSSGLFTGDDAALAKLKEARGLFGAYQGTFKPQGAGDDVGRAMQRIVERDAQPQEVANFLYGSSQVGGTGLSSRLAERVRGVLGADSAEWGAVRQGLVSRALGDGTPEQVAGRIEHLITGPGRVLANRVLTGQQINGLRAYQRGIEAATKAEEAVPEWVQAMAKGGFNPQSAVNDLIGAGTVGSRASSAPLARAVRGFFGPDSAEWSAVRQAAWQRLTAKPEGGTEDFGSQALANRIADFLSGKGRQLAETLYSPEEIGHMKSFASVLRTITPPKGASPNSDTAPALGSMLTKLSGRGNQIAALLGAAHGGPVGALAGYGVGKGLEKTGKAIADRGRSARAVRATQGAGVTLAPAEPVQINWGRAGAGAGIAIGD